VTRRHRVTITRWRDAQADPPGHPGGVVTDQGLAWYGHTPDGEGPWYSELGAFGSPPLDPQPSVWADVVPPDEDALTVDDLHALLRYAERNEARGAWMGSLARLLATAAARLRRALEATEDEHG
jgi:hypothetical protein